LKLAAPITAIGVDADDTLSHNGQFFARAQDHFAALLAGHTDTENLLPA
jgi:putative hydrolase of the HAD superfamily